jgi:exodeoxyribonuclease V gamma subunit
VSRLHVVRATSIAELADGLVRDLAASPPQDPFAPIEVAVPSRGMERWLTQRLATDLGASDGEHGVCANVRFPFPGALVQRAIQATLGPEAPADDPWAPQRLAWPVLSYLEALPDDPAHLPLRSHLRDRGGPATRRRFPLARRIADLFDRYAMYRPAMVHRWEQGEAVGADGNPLPGNVAWQPPLWRTLVRQLGVPSLEARFRRAIDAMRDGAVARPDDLPAAVTVFGVVSLPPLHLDLLAALAAHRRVTIHALTACTAWRPDEPAPEPTHPLLASCGVAARHGHTSFARHLARDGRDDAVPPAPGEAVQLVLGEPAPAAATASVTDAPVPGGEPRTALGVLQADVRADRRRGPHAHPPVPLHAEDRSVQVHACHGPTRQLEVLREVLLGLLEDDRTLQPRDIVVLTPDIAAFDPVISAVFSDGDRPGERRGDAANGVPALPFRVADRTVRDENVVAQVLLELLDLVPARVGASTVVDLLGTPPVSARFGLSASDLERLPTWVLGTGISWGVDADHRRELIGLDDRSHTWEAGLDRLVLGATTPDDGHRIIDGVVPYDDVEGREVDLLGRVLAATDAIFAARADLREPRTIAAWREALERVLDQLLDPGPGARGDADLTWQLAAVRETLTTVVDDSARPGTGSSEVPLTLEEVRAVLGAHLGQVSGTAHYGTGAITFAGLEPLRNVPHRVVCLVGLDDGSLPRAASRHGFDLISAHPEPGDPDPRIEDRQLLLDAVLSAGDHLVVTYTGHDPRSNEVQQPAVPISELLDVLDRSLTIDEGSTDTVRGRLVTSHPLQPHSARYFRDPQGDEEEVPRAFDRRQFSAAIAAAGERTPAAGFFPTGRPLPPPGPEDLDPDLVELADLLRFLDHPVRYLLQRRVGVSLGEDDRRLEDRDPTELDHLGKWKLGQDLLERTLGGTPADGWREFVLACGNVPVGGLGEVQLDGIEDLVGALCSHVDGIEGVRTPIPVDVSVPVSGAEGREVRLVGTVEVVGSTVLHVSVSTLKAKHRLGVWTRMLAATLARPDLAPSGRLLTRRNGGVDDTVLRPLVPTEHEGGEGPVDVQTLARTHLGHLVELYLRGHHEPVLLPPDVAHTYAKARGAGTGHRAAVLKADGDWSSRSSTVTWDEQRNAYNVQAFGAERDLAELVETSSFADDAVRVWTPLLAAEGAS